MPAFVPTAAAILFLALSAVACLFQMALVAGAPWGDRTLGGRWPGRLPPAGRLVASLALLVLIACAAIVTARAGLAFPSLHNVADLLMWGVVAMCAASVLANGASPSRTERNTWLPVASLMFVSSMTVAVS